MNMAAKEVAFLFWKKCLFLFFQSPYSENGNLNESEIAPLSLTVLPLADVDTNISIKMKDAGDFFSRIYCFYKAYFDGH